MDWHTIYPLFYSLTATASTGIVFAAMRVRLVREGVPINFGLLHALGGASVALWASVGVVQAWYA